MGRGEYHRQNAKISTDELLPLRLADLKKIKFLTPGKSSLLEWTRNGQKFASVQYTIKDSSIIIAYTIKDNEDNPITVNKTIPLTLTPCNFGGHRKWFCCSCGRKVATMFICGQKIACRLCFNAVYPSQREDAINRLWGKINKLEAKLKDNCDRPKGMHMQTFARIKNKWMRANIKKYELIELEFSRRFPGMEF